MPVSKEERAVPSRSRHATRKIILLIVLLLVLLFAGWYLRNTYSYYQRIKDGTIDLSEFSDGGISKVSDVETVASPNTFFVNRYEDDPSFGPVDAKLTIVAFEDFECPFCGKEFPTIKTVLAKYSDQIRFVYRDFPISDIHADAQKAAEAGQCAHEQGGFWQYHDLLYTHQDALSVSALKIYAGQAGLDQATFDNCLDSDKYKDEVLADYQDGSRAGAIGTPTFFFNGNRVSGVISVEGFDQIINYFLTH